MEETVALLELENQTDLGGKKTHYYCDRYEKRWLLYGCWLYPFRWLLMIMTTWIMCEDTATANTSPLSGCNWLWCRRSQCWETTAPAYAHSHHCLFFYLSSWSPIPPLSVKNIGSDKAKKEVENSHHCAELRCAVLPVSDLGLWQSSLNRLIIVIVHCAKRMINNFYTTLNSEVLTYVFKMTTRIIIMNRSPLKDLRLG